MSAAEHCDKTLLVQAEFDGELDAAQSAELRSHRATCAVCQATYATLEHTRATLRQDGLYHQAPASLRATLTAQLAAQSRPVPMRSRFAVWWGRPIAGFGAGLATAAAIFLFALMPVQQAVLDQVTASHVRALQPGHLSDVVSTDLHTVKPWFDGKLDFAPPVKDLTDKDFPLKGGRLDYIDNRSVAALIYQHGKHTINLFAWPDARGGDTGVTNSERNGYNVAHWTQSGMALWAISDMDKAELAQFAQQWRQAP